MFKKISIFILFLVLTLLGKSATAQITIAPVMLFLDQQNRFGTILILNGSDKTQEISIEFPFGYPETNDQGNIAMVYDDSISAQKYGISDVIRGFPKNFTLQPGQRQIVRLTVRPKNFQDGMYWSRIRTTSTPQSPPIGETSSDAITTQITYKFQQVTTVFYKHGTVNTGINIKNLSSKQEENVVDFIADVDRTGNAPFLGSIILTLKDASGNTVVEKKSSTSIYFDYKQVFQVAKDQLPAGNYNAQFKFISERTDVPGTDVVQMDPVSRSINVTIK